MVMACQVRIDAKAVQEGLESPYELRCITMRGARKNRVVARSQVRGEAGYVRGSISKRERNYEIKGGIWRG